MYGSQPETQMLQLWSNHRRRAVYTVQSITDKKPSLRLIPVTRGLTIWTIALAILALFLAGCVAHYPANGYGRGYGHHHYHHGYSGYHGRYEDHGWRGRDRRYDDD